MLRKDRMPAMLGVLMVNIFIVMVEVGLITPILPALIKEFGASGQAMGLLLSIFALPESVSREQMEAARKRKANSEGMWQKYATSLKSAYAMIFVIVFVMTFWLAIFLLQKRV
ncbi:hypothetical protein [Brevibacillus parabrevis]|uniref:hypothetical protein n=1 Tax=Brevibacillus parabrevis TaxID=54914 RepID=UPI0028D4B717|nr:hypothetical protein [Brevibacillus parabrevis]